MANIYVHFYIIACIINYTTVKSESLFVEIEAQNGMKDETRIYGLFKSTSEYLSFALAQSITLGI